MTDNILILCPLCNKDFAYNHESDKHLMRSNMPLNTGTLGLSEEDLLEHDVPIIICNECNKKDLI